MKFFTTLCLVFVCSFAFAQDLRSVLLAQLKNTHNNQEWFVPASTAIEGLTAEQAAWKDKGNHSAGELLHHIVFWNERVLVELNHQKNPEFKGSNDETFDKFDQKQWPELVKRFETVMAGMEKVVTDATEDQVKAMAKIIANISVHNAYHTGQIVSVRKAQGSWTTKTK